MLFRSSRAPRRFKDDVGLTSNEEPNEPSANRRANADEFESFGGQRRRTESAAPSEFNRDARSRSTSDFAPRSERDPFVENSEPEVRSTKESTKAQAMRLMKEAQEAMNDGQLQSARALAMEALDLPVVYGPLDDRPEQLLAQIDALLKKNRKPAVATLSESDLPSVESLATLKSTKSTLSDEQAPPALKSDLSDEQIGRAHV